MTRSSPGIASAIDAARQSLVAAAVGSCTCNTKSPNMAYHDASCRALKIASAMDDLDTISSLARSSAAALRASQLATPTKQDFIRLGIAAFKEHELREIVATFCKLPGIAPQPATPTGGEAGCPTDDPNWPESQPCSVCGAFGPWFDTPQNGECVSLSSAGIESEAIQNVGNAAPISDVRWAINVLLEKIAAKFEANETMDIWRSDAAATVRGFKHDLSGDAAQPSLDITDDMVERGARAIFRASTYRGYDDARLEREWLSKRDALRDQARSVLAVALPSDERESDE